MQVSETVTYEEALIVVCVRLKAPVIINVNVMVLCDVMLCISMDMCQNF
jgi:hypothetical protein